MGNVSFIKTPEEVRYFHNFLNKGILENQEGLILAWETRRELLQRIVPEPLKVDGPYVLAYVSYIFGTNFWKDYSEAGLLIPVEYQAQNFTYILAMPIAGKNDMPIFLGREGSGIPKKNADEISVYRSGDYVKVGIERNGIRFFEAEAEIGEFNDPIAERIFAVYKEGNEAAGNCINFIGDLDARSDTGFSSVKLVAQTTTTTYKKTEKARVTSLKLAPSSDDPWSELEVVQQLGAVYYRSDAVMGPVKALAEQLDPAKYAPYLLAKYDSSVVGHEYRNFKITK